MTTEWTLHHTPHRPSVVARFAQYVDTSAGPDACHPWLASRQKRGGYGQLRDGSKTLKAHRIALEIALGRRLLPEEHALHTCDNPPCCNAAHLYVGDNAQNVRDTVARGRFRRGRHSKLTAADVDHIRAGGVAREWATLLGVHIGTIHRIRRGERWPA